MDNLPSGFDRPRRRWGNWKWMALPALVLLIFGFIMLKTIVAGEKVEQKREDAAFLDYMAKRQEIERKQAEDRLERLRNPPPPIADEDEARDMGNGITSHDFAGVSVEYPSEMNGHVEDQGEGVRQLVLLGESTILITVIDPALVGTFDPPPLLPGAAAVQRTIAGAVREGKRGKFEGDQLETELYVFPLGPFHIRLTYRPHGDAGKAEAEIAMVAQSLRV